MENLLSLSKALQALGTLSQQLLRQQFSQQTHPNPHLNGWSLQGRDPEVLRQILPLMSWVYHYYYRVSTDGWEHIPTDQPVMFIGSHNGGLAAPDMHMMLYDWCCRFGTEKPLYGLMHPSVWQASPVGAQLATQMGAVRAHPRMGLAALSQKASIVVYPGGAQDVFRPYALRHKICFYNRKGFIKLALKKGVPIVPMISTGAHSNLIVLGDLYPQVQQLHEWGMPWLMGIDPEVFPVYLGLPWGLAVGPVPHIPLPIKIHTRICKPIEFQRYGADASKDRRYVEDCYQQVTTRMQAELDALVMSTS